MSQLDFCSRVCWGLVLHSGPSTVGGRRSPYIIYIYARYVCLGTLVIAWRSGGLPLLGSQQNGACRGLAEYIGTGRQHSTYIGTSSLKSGTEPLSMSFVVDCSEPILYTSVTSSVIGPWEPVYRSGPSIKVPCLFSALLSDYGSRATILRCKHLMLQSQVSSMKSVDFLL